MKHRLQVYRAQTGDKFIEDKFIEHKQTCLRTNKFIEVKFVTLFSTRVCKSVRDSFKYTYQTQVVHKKLADGKFYKKKGVVLQVRDSFVGEIKMIETGHVLKLGGRPIFCMGWLRFGGSLKS